MRFSFLFIILVTLAAIFIDVPKFPWAEKFPLKLGLDLQGGTELILQAKMDGIKQEDIDSAHESAREVIERRVNLYGVSEAVVQTSKVGDSRRILVELPGVKESSKAASLVGQTAQLDFRELPIGTSSATPFEFVPTGLTGADLKKSTVTFGSGAQAGPQVAIEFTSEGAGKFAEITKRNVNKPLGMFLDGVPISWPPPVVQQEILGGNAVISGQFSTEEAKNLSIQLNAGALPVPITILEQRLIGPSLGQDSLNKSLIAGAIGLIIIAFYMGAYYGILGLVATLALVIYSLLILAIFKTGLFILPPVTLTLAGIAGFILSVGMAVDANILIFERMKEEQRWGKSKKVALELGFKRAWSSIWASNVCSLLIAGILIYFGSSVVRGFAITLAIGVLVSMFSAIIVTRTFLRYVIH
jgi:preprotein translocase subunit SecD